MTTSEFFEYFEEEHNVILTMFQKREFIKIIQLNLPTKNPFRTKLGKTVVTEMVEEYRKLERESRK